MKTTEENPARSAREILPGALALLRDTMQKPTIIIDSREPDDPHPWARYWEGVAIQRGTLPTGDFCLAGNSDVAVERKTLPDLAGCMTKDRERFTRELSRGCHLDRFAVIVSGTLGHLIQTSGMHPNSIIGTLSAWMRRYRVPIMFAGDDLLAAKLCLAFLTQPAREAKQLLKAVTTPPSETDASYAIRRSSNEAL